jgi:hypothetical protein
MSLGGSGDADELGVMFDLLSNRTRRCLLYYLREHGTATRSELVDVLTGWAATGHETGVATRDDWQRMRATLHHVHLPKLTARGPVEHDPETGVVRLGSVPSWADRCMDVAFESDRTLASGAEPMPESVPDDRH